MISGLRMYKVISEREVDVPVSVRSGKVARLAGLTSHEVRAIEACAEEFDGG